MPRRWPADGRDHGRARRRRRTARRRAGDLAQADYARGELADRRRLRFPPAVRVATVTGGPEAVASGGRARLPSILTEVLRHRPMSRTAACARSCASTTRTGATVAVALRAEIVRQATTRRKRRARRAARGRRATALQVRFDDAEPFLEAVASTRQNREDDPAPDRLRRQPDCRGPEPARPRGLGPRIVGRRHPRRTRRRAASGVLTPTPVAEAAERAGPPGRQGAEARLATPTEMNCRAEARPRRDRRLRRARARAAAVSAPRLGWINLHFSLLPRWRGAAPVQRAIIGRRRGDRRDRSSSSCPSSTPATSSRCESRADRPQPDRRASAARPSPQSGADLLPSVVDDLADGTARADAADGRGDARPEARRSTDGRARLGPGCRGGRRAHPRRDARTRRLHHDRRRAAQGACGGHRARRAALVARRASRSAAGACSSGTATDPIELLEVQPAGQARDGCRRLVARARRPAGRRAMTSTPPPSERAAPRCSPRAASPSTCCGRARVRRVRQPAAAVAARRGAPRRGGCRARHRAHLRHPAHAGLLRPRSSRCATTGRSRRSIRRCSTCCASACHQLLSMRVAPHAAVDESVALVARGGHGLGERVRQRGAPHDHAPDAGGVARAGAGRPRSAMRGSRSSTRIPSGSSRVPRRSRPRGAATSSRRCSPPTTWRRR